MATPTGSSAPESSRASRDEALALPSAKPPSTPPPRLDESTVRLEWPDDSDETTALPITAFQVVGPEEDNDDRSPEWPHPSTWEVPGTQWEDLNEPTPDSSYQEDRRRNNGNK